MTIPGLEEIRELRQTLAVRSVKDRRELLHGVGIYFEVTLPSNLNDDCILETEVLLNDLYLQADEEGWSAERSESIEKALSKAGALCDEIKRRPDEPRSELFFKTAKELGKVLKFFE